MYATMNTTGMNSTENMNSFLDDTYKFWDEAMAENPYWLLFMVLLMCVFYPIAFFMVICNAIKNVPLISEHNRPHVRPRTYIL